MKRIVQLTLVIFTALLLQTTVFPQLTLAGAKPELIYLITILMAMLEGPTTGAVLGFSGGMGQDFLQNAPKGITALTLTLLGYSVGLIRTYIVTPSPWLPMVLVSVGTFVGLIFYGIVSALVGQMDTGWWHLLRVALFSGIYNGLLTPVVFPILRRISEANRAPSLFRW